MANNLNFFRGKYSDYLALKDEGKVLDTNLYFTIPDDEDKKIADDPKSSSYCLYQGEHLLASATHESDIKGILSELESITSRIDNIGSEIATYTISAITPTDTNVETEYALMKTQGETTVVEGETIKIYKDSALKNVAMVNSGTTQYLKFTYTLADGTEKDVNFDVSSLLVASEFKEGLQVNSNGEVSVKVASATKTNTKPEKEANKNFLSLDNNGLAVKSVDSDATVLHQNLTVAGLSGSFGAGNYQNGQVISAGTSLYTILENILCKESYPATVGTVAPSASVSMSNLTLTLSASGDQEVGTLVSLNTGKTNGATVTTTHPKITGMTNGFSLTAGTPQQCTETILSATCTPTIASNVFRISATINSGFNADTETNVKTTPTTVTGNSNASLAVTKLGCIVEGENKITINASGSTYTYSAPAVTFEYSGNTYNTFYYCSNLKKTDEAHKVSRASASGTTTVPTKSTYATVTGKYKYFMGGSQLQDPKDLDSAAIRGLVKNGWVTKDNTTSIGTWTSPGYSVVIACPAKYKLATITDSMGNSYLSKFSKTATVSVKTGSITTDYTVYMYPLANNDKMDFKNITLTKK